MREIIKCRERQEVVAALIKKYPHTGNRMLARMLYKDNKEWFPNYNAADCAIRHARGNRGKKSRESKPTFDGTKRKNGNPPLSPCPPSKEETWEPFILNSKRLLVLSDIHVPYHSEKALTAAVEYGKDFGPDTVLLNGDTIDFYTISRFQTNPKERDLKGEIDATKELLGWLKECFPKAKLIWKDGNHDERWTKFIWAKAPELWDIAACRLENILELERMNVEHVSDQRLVMAGRLPILHGHEVGRGISSPVNQARGLFLRTIHTCLVGHGHRTSTHCEPDMNHNETTTWSTGCLCGRRPEYARFNKWNWGFACVEIEKDGQFNVHNLRISESLKVRAA